MRKKAAAIVLACAMVIGLTACGGSGSSGGSSETQTGGTVEAGGAAAAGDASGPGEAPSGWTPTGTVSIVVPAGAGGNTDLSARVFAQYAKGISGVDFIVVNANGAAGSVAANQVLSACPSPTPPPPRTLLPGPDVPLVRWLLHLPSSLCLDPLGTQPTFLLSTWVLLCGRTNLRPGLRAWRPSETRPR